MIGSHVADGEMQAAPCTERASRASLAEGSPRTTRAPTGCRSNNRPAASGPATQDQSMASGRFIECRQLAPNGRQIDEPADVPQRERLVRVAPTRIRRIEPPDQVCRGPIIDSASAVIEIETATATRFNWGSCNTIGAESTYGTQGAFFMSNSSIGARAGHRKAVASGYAVRELVDVWSTRLIRKVITLRPERR